MSAAPRDTTVDLRDGVLTFRVLTAGTGVPLVYFHSLHERGGWSPFLARLAERYTVYAPFHPGVQGSTGVEALDDVHDLTLAYDELMQALELPSAHLVGHFFGGMVAAEIAAVFPRRARRLALLAPLGLWQDDAPVADVVILPIAELLPVLWRDPGSEAAKQWAVLPELDAENVAAQIESVQRRSSMAKFVWPIPDKGIKKRLHRIAAPTLLLWGESDRTNPVVYAEDWQRRIKNAALRLMPGGHMMLHESPREAADVVAEFLA
jgi:pimeloyl-ACP methyl ester carboxylesterase